MSRRGSYLHLTRSDDTKQCQTLLNSLFIRLGTVDDFVTVRASTFNADQQFSIRSVQQVQYQSITNYGFQQISITCEI